MPELSHRTRIENASDQLKNALVPKSSQWDSAADDFLSQMGQAIQPILG